MAEPVSWSTPSGSYSGYVESSTGVWRAQTYTPSPTPAPSYSYSGSAGAPLTNVFIPTPAPVQAPALTLPQQKPEYKIVTEAPDLSPKNQIVYAEQNLALGQAMDSQQKALEETRIPMERVYDITPGLIEYVYSITGVLPGEPGTKAYEEYKKAYGPLQEKLPIGNQSWGGYYYEKPKYGDTTSSGFSFSKEGKEVFLSQFPELKSLVEASAPGSKELQYLVENPERASSELSLAKFGGSFASYVTFGLQPEVERIQAQEAKIQVAPITAKEGVAMVNQAFLSGASKQGPTTGKIDINLPNIDYQYDNNLKEAEKALTNSIKNAPGGENFGMGATYMLSEASNKVYGKDSLLSGFFSSTIAGPIGMTLDVPIQVVKDTPKAVGSLISKPGETLGYGALAFSTGAVVAGQGLLQQTEGTLRGEPGAIGQTIGLATIIGAPLVLRQFKQSIAPKGTGTEYLGPKVSNKIMQGLKKSSIENTESIIPGSDYLGPKVSQKTLTQLKASRPVSKEPFLNYDSEYLGAKVSQKTLTQLKASRPVSKEPFLNYDSEYLGAKVSSETFAKQLKTNKANPPKVIELGPIKEIPKPQVEITVKTSSGSQIQLTKTQQITKGVTKSSSLSFQDYIPLTLLAKAKREDQPRTDVFILLAQGYSLEEALSIAKTRQFQKVKPDIEYVNLVYPEGEKVKTLSQTVSLTGVLERTQQLTRTFEKVSVGQIQKQTSRTIDLEKTFTREVPREIETLKITPITGTRQKVADIVKTFELTKTKEFERIKPPEPIQPKFLPSGNQRQAPTTINKLGPARIPKKAKFASGRQPLLTPFEKTKLEFKTRKPVSIFAKPSKENIKKYEKSLLGAFGKSGLLKQKKRGKK